MIKEKIPTESVGVGSEEMCEMEVVCHERGSNCLLISKYQLQTLISLIHMSGCKMEESEFNLHIYTSDSNVDIASCIQCKNPILVLES